MYYPKSQIKLNLFTNGSEYILSTTNQEYKGDYYEVSNGNKYTGKSPEFPPNILLIEPPQLTQATNDPQILASLDQNLIQTYSIFPEYTKSLPDRSTPSFNSTLPTTEDQQQGQFSRYFCKKTNENRYMEIDFNTYNKLRAKDSKIAWDLYNPTQIIWLIKGNREQVYNSNKGSVQSIEQNLSCYGFTQYFKNDFSKYYLES